MKPPSGHYTRDGQAGRFSTSTPPFLVTLLIRNTDTFLPMLIDQWTLNTTRDLSSLVVFNVHRLYFQ